MATINVINFTKKTPEGFFFKFGPCLIMIKNFQKYTLTVVYGRTVSIFHFLGFFMGH